MLLRGVTWLTANVTTLHIAERTEKDLEGILDFGDRHSRLTTTLTLPAQYQLRCG